VEVGHLEVAEEGPLVEEDPLAEDHPPQDQGEEEPN